MASWFVLLYRDPVGGVPSVTFHEGGADHEDAAQKARMLKSQQMSWDRTRTILFLGEEIFTDKCQICYGSNGGVPGNENIVDGKIMCDYCHAARSAPQPTPPTA